MNMDARRVESPCAAELADLTTIQVDLHRTEQLCIRIVSAKRSGAGDDPLVIDAMWHAALISYFRCFKKSKRRALDIGPLRALKGDPIGLHNYLEAQRDKFVAHSENPFEDMMIGIGLDWDQRPRVIGWMQFGKRMGADPEETILALAGVAHSLNVNVEGRMKVLGEQLVAEARALSDEELKQLAPMEQGFPRREDASKNRFQK
jgi:hypothetical protein